MFPKIQQSHITQIGRPKYTKGKRQFYNSKHCSLCQPRVINNNSRHQAFIKINFQVKNWFKKKQNSPHKIKSEQQNTITKNIIRLIAIVFCCSDLAPFFSNQKINQYSSELVLWCFKNKIHLTKINSLVLNVFKKESGWYGKKNDKIWDEKCCLEAKILKFFY